MDRGKSDAGAVYNRGRNLPDSEGDVSIRQIIRSRIEQVSSPLAQLFHCDTPRGRPNVGSEDGDLCGIPCGIVSPSRFDLVVASRLRLGCNSPVARSI